MQHTARLFWIVEPIHTFLLLFYIAKDLPMVVLVMSKRQMRRSRTIAIAWLIPIYGTIVELENLLNLIYIVSRIARKVSSSPYY